MQSFILMLLTGSAAMSVVILLYMAIMPLLAKRYSVTGSYYAWLIIVAGLIIPFGCSSDVPLSALRYRSMEMVRL